MVVSSTSGKLPPASVPPTSSPTPPSPSTSGSTSQTSQSFLIRLGIWLSNHSGVVSVFTAASLLLDYVSTYLDRAKYPQGHDIHPFVMFNPLGISLRFLAVIMLIVLMNTDIPFRVRGHGGDIRWFAHLANLPVIFLTLSFGVVPNFLLYFLGFAVFHY